MKYRSIHLAIAIIVLLGLLSGCAPATAAPTEAATVAPTAQPASPTATQTPVHLKVGIFNFSSFAPLFIGYEDGYFAAQGLDVELIDFGSASSEFIPAVLSKEIDIGAYTLSVAVLNAIADGANIKYVADKGFLNPDGCTTDAWVASQPLLDGGGLTDSASLQGKNIVSISGGTFEYALDIMLEQGGLTQSDIEVLTVNDSAARVDGLKSGSIDVAPLSEPWITRAAAQNAGAVYQPLSAQLPNFSLGAILYGPSILEQDSDVGDRFMVAYLQAVQQFNEGKTDRNIEIIAKYTHLDPEEIKAACWTSFRPDGSIDSEAVTNFGEWALAKGYIDTPLTFEQIVDTKYLESANHILNP